MQKQDLKILLKQIEQTYKKILDSYKNQTLQKIKIIDLKQTNFKIQYILQDIQKLQDAGVDINLINNYKTKFNKLQTYYQSIAKKGQNKTVSKQQFYDKINKILFEKIQEQTIEPIIQTDKKFEKQFNAKQQMKSLISNDSPIKSAIVTSPLEIGILSKQQQNEYRNRLNNFYKKKQDNPLSFKTEFQNLQSKSLNRKKYESSISKKNVNVRNKSQVKKQQDMISKLIQQNNELKERLMYQTYQNEQKQKIQNSNIIAYEQKKSNIPFQNSKFINYDKRSKTPNIEADKYLMYNQILKKQNSEIYQKLAQLQQVLEELAKQNMKLREIERSSRAISNNMQSNKKSKEISEIKNNTIYPSRIYNQISLQEKDDYQRNHMKANQYILPYRNNDIMKMNIPPKPLFASDISQIKKIQYSNQHKNGKMKLSKVIQNRQGSPQSGLQDNEFKTLQQQEHQPFQTSFDTFKLINSINDSKFEESYQKQTYQNQKLVNMNKIKNTTKSLLIRNKVAFFKNSLVLLKDDPYYQIAYKKSSLNKQLDTSRFIFYINNRTNNQEMVTINYTFDFSIYSINVVQKVTKIKKNTQGRQQIIIKFKDNSGNHSNFIICHFRFTRSSYDIILPVLFLSFQQGLMKINENQAKSVIIVPDKQFSTPHLMSYLIPLINVNEDQNLQFLKGEKPHCSEIIVVTKRGSSGLRIQWKNGLVKVTGDKKWIQLLAWILSQSKLKSN